MERNSSPIDKRGSRRNRRRWWEWLVLAAVAGAFLWMQFARRTELDQFSVWHTRGWPVTHSIAWMPGSLYKLILECDSRVVLVSNVAIYPAGVVVDLGATIALVASYAVVLARARELGRGAFRWRLAVLFKWTFLAALTIQWLHCEEQGYHKLRSLQQEAWLGGLSPWELHTVVFYLPLGQPWSRLTQSPWYVTGPILMALACAAYLGLDWMCRASGRLARLTLGLGAPSGRHAALHVKPNAARNEEGA